MDLGLFSICKENKLSTLLLKKETQMLPLGHGNYMQTENLLVILSPDNAPAKKLRQRADEEGRLLVATAGKKTRSIIVTKSNHVLLSSFSPEALRSRIDEEKSQKI